MRRSEEERAKFLEDMSSGDVAAGLSPDEYLVHAQKWADLGAKIIGGCCGTTPEHVAILRRHREILRT
jgi:methionine synthase I (cobalamin-dependent)